MPSLLRGRKSKAEFKQQQNIQQATVSGSKTVPVESSSHQLSEDRKRKSCEANKASMTQRPVEEGLEPFPPFIDTPFPGDDVVPEPQGHGNYTNEGTGNLVGHATEDVNPNHPYMTRERFRQVSDDIGPSPLCMGIGSGGNSVAGKSGKVPALLYGLGKRIWGTGRGKKELDGNEQDLPDDGAGIDGTAIASTDEQQQEEHLEVANQLIESGGDESCEIDPKAGVLSSQISGVAEQDATAEPIADPAAIGAHKPVDPTFKAIGHDPLLWQSAMPFEKTAVYSLPQQWSVIKILNVGISCVSSAPW
ncbi:hypothetical protein KEM55_008535 [Ascosphaera atra]|nr:hypothetical protein KEM55_008535 [Ascosphaera atra]